MSLTIILALVWRVMVLQQMLRNKSQRDCIDLLTGLTSKHGIKQHGQRMLAHAKRAGENLSVFFMDMDGFKALNDTNGHAAGDEMLRYFATHMPVRQEDLFGRWQGDEFVAVIRGGRVAAEHFNTRVAQAMKDTVHYAQNSGWRYLSLSISIGCASIEEGALHLFWGASNHHCLEHICSEPLKDGYTIDCLVDKADIIGMAEAKCQRYIRR